MPPDALVDYVAGVLVKLHPKRRGQAEQKAKLKARAKELKDQNPTAPMRPGRKGTESIGATLEQEFGVSADSAVSLVYSADHGPVEAFILAWGEKRLILDHARAICPFLKTLAKTIIAPGGGNTRSGQARHRLELVAYQKQPKAEEHEELAQDVAELEPSMGFNAACRLIAERIGSTPSTVKDAVRLYRKKREQDAVEMRLSLCAAWRSMPNFIELAPSIVMKAIRRVLDGGS